MIRRLVPFLHINIMFLNIYFLCILIYFVDLFIFQNWLKYWWCGHECGSSTQWNFKILSVSDIKPMAYDQDICRLNFVFHHFCCIYGINPSFYPFKEYGPVITRKKRQNITCVVSSLWQGVPVRGSLMVKVWQYEICAGMHLYSFVSQSHLLK